MTAYENLARALEANHKFLNGVWFTAYENIRGLKLLATSTNGTSGIGTYARLGRVYWSRNDKTGSFSVESAHR